MLDLWPVEWYRDHRLKRFEIAYVAEAHGGDRLSFYREAMPATDSGAQEFCVRIVRTDGTECCRSKVKFL